MKWHRFRFRIVGFALGAWLLGSESPAQANETSPVGYWKTIDDDGKTEKSIVRIYEKNGKLHGKIVKIINPDKPNPVCDKCSGSRKDQPVLGMVFMWNLKKDGDEWSGGRILDPENGKDYKCYIALKDGGKKLKVRGYVGVSLFGRTQHWFRTSPPSEE